MKKCWLQRAEMYINHLKSRARVYIYIYIYMCVCVCVWKDRKGMYVKGNLVRMLPSESQTEQGAQVGGKNL